MRICLYEDRRTADLGPLTLTRPASDLLCGLTPLGAKQAQYFGAETVGHLCRPLLADLLRARDSLAPVNDPTWLRSAPAVLVNARWLPPFHPALGPVIPDPTAGPVLGMCDGDVAFAVLEPRQLQSVSPATIDDCLDDWVQSLPTVEAGGHVVRYPWELVGHNPDQIARDFVAATDEAAGFHPTGLALVGPADRLFIHPTARLDPLVVADTTGGPVWIGPGVVVNAFTRLEGPCAIGEGTHLFGAKIRAGTTIGPHCRIGGEIECSIVQGYTNKYHEGFLGHSCVGEWVNLAAGTNTGDLRCDYRTIAVSLGGTIVPTGQNKVGGAIGDHARTGMGVLLNCGSVLGAFATVLPTGELAPREVPSFGQFGPGGFGPAADVDAALETAAVMMRRRGRELTPELKAVYRAAAGETQRPVRSTVGAPPGRRKTA